MANDAKNPISLPKSGGAIKGIGETFQPNLFSGTANHSIPIAASPGRNGFGPSLSLQYSSGNGNGCFGLGWALSIPRITRKTEKGLPKYDDDDVFVLTGAEDLVPLLREVGTGTSPGGDWAPVAALARGEHLVYLYRPRTEGLFARIERWVHTGSGVVHWRVITRDNVTNLYGKSAGARLADPANELRVYEWLLEETYDAYGNHVVYEYARDDPALYSSPDPSRRLPGLSNQNRLATQLYIRRICYANLPKPLLDAEGRPLTYPDGSAIGQLCAGQHYAFEVVVDYGDWAVPTRDVHRNAPAEGSQELLGLPGASAAGITPAPLREDAFAQHRAGFEVRTLRLCRRVLMFHHFAELGGPTLVKSTNFDYRVDEHSRLALLQAVTVTGHRRDGSGRYVSASMSPVEFGYSTFRPQEQRFRPLSIDGHSLAPASLSDLNAEFVDLFGDGLPDLLQGTAVGWRYWRNMGNGAFSGARLLENVPAAVALGEPGMAFGDMAGDGRVDLLVRKGGAAGFFEAAPSGGWRPFRPFKQSPSFDLGDARVRLADLTGDGRSDVLMSAEGRFVWFECLGEDGFASPRFIAKGHDAEDFPDTTFDDPAGRLRLADMSGDGLSDLVLIHNGRIEYWPNQGYGRFGRRVTMENAPRLEREFDPARLFLADLDGSGTSDLVYVDFDRVHFWFNQSGNGWSERQTILGTPLTTNATSVRFADVFGTGTATLVWSYDQSIRLQGGLNALDFCGGIKPYVLNEVNNNLGATTRVHYAPSTSHYVRDLAEGLRWVTTLPFPVQVVDKVEVLDHISKTRLVTTYKYHHGYYDGREREFRGFGRVDQFDSESYEFFAPATSRAAAGRAEGAFFAPTSETRSWFHGGVWFDADAAPSGGAPLDSGQLAERYRLEYYSGDSGAAPLADHMVERGSSPHQAHRALRGALLRTELYGHDGSARAAHPFVVTEQRHRVRQLQPAGPNTHAVYIAQQAESLTYHYEREPADPRVMHDLTLEVDDYGNPLRSLAIAYGRRLPDPGLPTDTDRQKQARSLISYKQTSFTSALADPATLPDVHRAPAPAESRTFELTGFGSDGSAARFTWEDWVADNFALLGEAAEIGYEQRPDPATRQRRLIEQSRTLYRRDDLSGLLPLSSIEPLALPGETYKLAFTPAMLEKAYGSRLDPAVLTSEGGYVAQDGRWWVPSGRMFYSPNAASSPAQELTSARARFFLPHRVEDAFGQSATTSHDAYALLPVEVVDPLLNRTSADNDYRALQPRRVTDPNRNRAEAAFDTLGMVVATAVMGKPGEAVGDSLDGFEPDLAPASLTEFDADPRALAAGLIQKATSRVIYDLQNFRRTGKPVYAATLLRETHASEPAPAGGLKVQIAFAYSDGFGRDVQRKSPAAPGPLKDGATEIVPRWVASGWTVFNNKGAPVLKFEPFFTATHRFEGDARAGVSPVLVYDPVGRMVATLQPNHTYEKVLRHPWRQVSYDLNDTCAPRNAQTGDPRTDADIAELARPYFNTLPSEEAGSWRTWHAQRIGGELGVYERNAAMRAQAHADTPGTTHLDALGRPFLTTARNRVVCADHDLDGTEEDLHTRSDLDLQGHELEVRDAMQQAGDALGRIVMRYAYDMLGQRIHQVSMDAGARWFLNDVAGKPIRGWDSRGHTIATAYDALRRPVRQTVRGSTAESDPRTLNREILVDKIEYGETLANAESLNLRTRIYRHFDSAGAVTNARLDDTGDPIEAFDFKGNLLCSTRRLARDYKAIPDWLQPAEPQFEAEFFRGSTRYDALSRPIQTIAPRSSLGRGRFNVLQPAFSEANLLERVDVWLEREAEPTEVVDRVSEAPSPVGVAGIDYDAKGQRRRIDYKNGASTFHSYDPLTFRLIQLLTKRKAADFPGDDPQPPIAGWPGKQIQNLRYTYDPAGNITHIQDDAQQSIYFRNKRVEPSNGYVYDALYRLIQATGREHLGQGGVAIPHSHNDSGRVGIVSADSAGRFAPNDGNAMGAYFERYVYDAVGNFLQMQHRGSDPAHAGWTRAYEYLEPCLAEDGIASLPLKTSNRLTRTSLSPERSDPQRESYLHDSHGNMVRMPHLGGGSPGECMRWSFHDRLRQSSLGGGSTCFYVCDTAGLRVRKVWEKAPGLIEERIYLEGLEIFRRHVGGTISVDTATMERETLDLMANTQRIAQVELRTLDATGADQAPRRLVRYQIGNQLRSVSIELDEQARVISLEEYSPYGSSTYQAVRSLTEAPKRYRSTGKERDEESGLYFHEARHFAPWLGRWVSADPSGLADGTNLFHYATGNPVRFVDPSGLEPEPTGNGCKPGEVLIEVVFPRSYTLCAPGEGGAPRPTGAANGRGNSPAGNKTSTSSQSTSGSTRAASVDRNEERTLDVADATGDVLGLAADKIEDAVGRSIERLEPKLKPLRDATSKAKDLSARAKAVQGTKAKPRAQRAAAEAAKKAATLVEETSALRRDLAILRGVARAFERVGPALDALSVGASFSGKAFFGPANTLTGRVTDGALTGTFDYMLGKRQPVLAAIEGIQTLVIPNKKYHPIPVSNTVNASISGLVMSAEALATGETLGLERLYGEYKEGEHGWFLWAASNTLEDVGGFVGEAVYDLLH